MANFELTREYIDLIKEQIEQNDIAHLTDRKSVV